jgi:NitT/TauT family transport system ATP-binding protein
MRLDSNCMSLRNEITEETLNISAIHLSYSYYLSSRRELPVLRDICLEMEQGSFNSIIGPSGCGKTTLLLCLAGLLPVSAPSIKLGEFPPHRARQEHKIGYVSQKPVFFEWLTMLENTLLPARISGIPAPRQADDLLTRFGLSGFNDRYPHELSGGMLSRAALARSLVHEPRFLLLDEAFNHLDEALREEINGMIQEIWLENRMTVVAITHSISEAVFLSDRIFLLSKKPSSVKMVCDVTFPRPRSRRLMRDAEFLAVADRIRDALNMARAEE